MPDCFICNTLIRNTDVSLKLPCCLRKVHDRCQMEISCRKWNKMAKNKKFDVEKCCICNRKINTPVEKVFYSLYMAIKLVRKQVTENDIETAKEILSDDWKKDVYNNFGDMLKDKYSISKIRNSNKSILESLSSYMIKYTETLLITSKLDFQSKLNSKNKDIEILNENELPSNVRDKM